MTRYFNSLPLHFLAGALVALLSTFVVRFGFSMTLFHSTGPLHPILYAFAIGTPLGIWIALNLAGREGAFLRDVFVFTITISIAYFVAIWATIYSSSILLSPFAIASVFPAIAVGGFIGGLPVLLLHGYLESRQDILSQSVKSSFNLALVALACLIMSNPSQALPVELEFILHPLWQGALCAIMAY